LEYLQFVANERIGLVLVSADRSSEDDEEVRRLPREGGQVVCPRVHVVDAVATSGQHRLEGPEVLEGYVADRDRALPWRRRGTPPRTSSGPRRAARSGSRRGPTPPRRRRDGRGRQNGRAVAQGRSPKEQCPKVLRTPAGRSVRCRHSSLAEDQNEAPGAERAQGQGRRGCARRNDGPRHDRPRRWRRDNGVDHGGLKLV